MGKHRNAFQLLEDAKRKVLQLQTKVARDAVSEHPEIAEYDSELRGLNKEMVKVNRWTKEEGGLASRIVRLNEQLATAQFNLSNATKRKEELSEQIKDIKDARQTKAESLVEDSEIDIDLDEIFNSEDA